MFQKDLCQLLKKADTKRVKDRQTDRPIYRLTDDEQFISIDLPAHEGGTTKQRAYVRASACARVFSHIYKRKLNVNAFQDRIPHNFHFNYNCHWPMHISKPK